MSAEEESAAPPAAGGGRERNADHVPLILTDVKEMQRKAFERGREVERKESGDLLRAAASHLAEAFHDLHRARLSDAAELGDFAVKLACVVAEALTGRIVEADEHDVRGLVDKVLAEALPEMKDDEIRLYGHPEDVSRLALHFERSDLSPRITLVPDQRMKRGEYCLRGGEVEFYSGIHERLEAMRMKLLEAVERSDVS